MVGERLGAAWAPHPANLLFLGSPSTAGLGTCTAGLGIHPCWLLQGDTKAVLVEAEHGWLLLLQFLVLVAQLLFLEKLLGSGRTSVLAQAGASLLCTLNCL